MADSLIRTYKEAIVKDRVYMVLLLIGGFLSLITITVFATLVIPSFSPPPYAYTVDSGEAWACASGGTMALKFSGVSEIPQGEQFTRRLNTTIIVDSTEYNSQLYELAGVTKPTTRTIYLPELTSGGVSPGHVEFTATFERHDLPPLPLGRAYGFHTVQIDWAGQRGEPTVLMFNLEVLDC